MLDKEEYPFYNYFYYSDYINEAFLLDKLKSKEKDEYPVLLKVLEDKMNQIKNEYSLINLLNFNEVLNLFNEKYSCSIKRDKAYILLLKNLKDEEIYRNNKEAIKTFMNFFNNLSDKEVKPENLKLTESSKLADFFIDDNNEYGNSYKKIYNKFIEEQNKEISHLLDIKINKGIFEKGCKDKINIQSANSNEIFITNLLDRFSFIEVVFNSSYRKKALDNNNIYNYIEPNLDLIENTMTELLLRNKKLFNDSIINFVYLNENLKFENKSLITEFNRLYGVNNINIGDKKILYKFYQDNKEKNDEFFKNILNDFIQIILFLISNKKLLEKDNANYLKDDSQISEVIEKLNKVSDNFKDLFKDKTTLTIRKITYLFAYYRDIIFSRIKTGLKPYQDDLDEKLKVDIEECFKKQSLIKEKEFKFAIRNFISLFLHLEKDNENNIKENKNNLVNYLDIPDIWDMAISSKSNFQKELKNLKELNVKINQVVSLYDYLGEDINEKFFEDVEQSLKKDEELKNIQAKKEPPNEVKIPQEDDDSHDDSKSSESSDDKDDDDDEEFNDKKYI